MRSISRRKLSTLVGLIAALTFSACTVEAGDEAAHALASKFAADSALSEELPADEPAAAPAAPPIHIVNSPDARAQAEKEKAAAVEEERRREAERRIADERARKEAARAAAEKAEAERLARAQREAEEAEMLARARAEAEERRMREERRLRELAQAEAERRRAAEKAREEQARLAEEERQRQAAEAKRLAEIAAREQERKAAEARNVEEENRRRADQARLEAIEAKHLSALAEQEAVRNPHSTRAAESWRRFEEEERMKVPEAERRAAEAQRQAEQRAAEARRVAALRQLEEEGRRRAEQARAIAELSAAAEARKMRWAEGNVDDRPLRSARESWADQHEESYVAPYTLGGPHSGDRPDFGSPGITRVTVLLVMEPGRRGIRRFNKTADPILCVGAGCYISSGADAPSHVMRRAKAFGPVVAIGMRAGKCSRSLTCVFRSVDLERPRSEVQPIDLRILRHDRRKPSIVMADPTCRTDGKRLACSRTVVADDYRMWIVPESVAERAGAVALESAVLNGLRDDGDVARAGSG